MRLLYLDRQNRRLIADKDNNTPDTLDKLYQGDIINLSVQVLDPSGSYYKIVEDADSLLNFSVGIPGIVSSSYVASSSLGYDAGTQTYTGIAYLNSNAVTNFLSGSIESDCYCEFELSSSIKNVRTTIYQSHTLLTADIIK